MGNKNNRGRAPVVPVAQQVARKQLAQQQGANQLIQAREQQAEQAEAQQLVQQKALARQHALEFDYTTLPKHSALSIKKDLEAGTVKLLINLDIVHPELTDKDPNLLTVLPHYAKLITKVEFKLLAPSVHNTREIYLLRVRNMMRTINCLNKFDIEEFQFIILVNKANNFAQMKLAAAAFGLNFKDWTMVTKVRGVEGTWNVDVGSQWDHKLARIYKDEFLTHKEK